MEYDYYYDVPTRVTSNNEIAVYNDERKVVYHLQKYHKNIWQKIVALQFTTWFINVVIRDMNEQELAKAEDIGVARRKWALSPLDHAEQIELTDTSKFKMTERKMEFKWNGKDYLISKKADDNQTILYEDRIPIVFMEESGKMPPRQNYIRFEKNVDLPEPVVICMLHLFEIGV